MASEILGLFSSPELYQQQQGALMNQQALQYAQLDPFERVTYGANLAGQRLGGALGGLLGGPDPQLQIISARQSVMQGVDPSNPESILNAAQQLANAGDQQGALTLADYARKAGSELALQQQRMREGRAASTPKELQIANAAAQLQQRIRELQAAPESPERNAELQIANDTLARLTTSTRSANAPKEIEIANARAQLQSRIRLLEKQPASEERDNELQTAKDTLASLPQAGGRAGQVPDAIEISRELALEAGPEGSEAYNKSYRENLKRLSSKDSSEKQLEFSRILVEAGYEPGTPQYQAEMKRYAMAEITGRSQGKGTTVTNVLPGQGKEGAKDIPAFRDKVIGTIDPFRKTVTAADSAITNIRDSIKTSNFASFRAAQTQFARAISGAGDLSQKELKAAGADPSLIGGTADYLSTLFTSTPTADTQKKLLSTLKAIRTVAAKKANEEISNQKKIAARAGYTQDDTALIFNFPEFESGAAPSTGKKTTTKTLKSGKVVTITED
jgi:hypothetical protein